MCCVHSSFSTFTSGNMVPNLTSLEVQVKHIYLSESERRATFKSWPFDKDVPCNADKMAEAGFIFTGSSREPDSAQCFYCNKTLDGWEEGDNPWKEHIKHAPKCEFAKLQKSESELTLKHWIDFVFNFRETIIKQTSEKMRESVQELMNSVKIE